MQEIFGIDPMLGVLLDKDRIMKKNEKGRNTLVVFVAAILSAVCL